MPAQTTGFPFFDVIFIILWRATLTISSTAVIMALSFRAFHPLNPFWAFHVDVAPRVVGHVALAVFVLPGSAKHRQAAPSEGVA